VASALAIASVACALYYSRLSWQLKALLAMGYISSASATIDLCKYVRDNQYVKQSRLASTGDFEKDSIERRDIVIENEKEDEREDEHEEASIESEQSSRMLVDMVEGSSMYSAWRWTSFIGFGFLTQFGIWNPSIELDLGMKCFLCMSHFFLIHAAVTLTKFLRDSSEAQTLERVHRIN